MDNLTPKTFGLKDKRPSNLDFKMSDKGQSEAISNNYTPIASMKKSKTQFQKPIIFQGDGSQTVRGQMHLLQDKKEMLMSQKKQDKHFLFGQSNYQSETKGADRNTRNNNEPKTNTIQFSSSSKLEAAFKKSGGLKLHSKKMLHTAN